MNMIATNWRLFRGCAALLQRNRRLMIFPLLAIAAVLIEMTLFSGAALLYVGCTGGLHAATFEHWFNTHLQSWWQFLAFIMPCYLILNFTIIFCNSALVACALAQLEGGDATIRAGLRIAWENRGRIFIWSLITGIVSTLIQYVLSAIPGVPSKLAGMLGGLAWSLATFFVVPLLVFERTNVFDSITRSAELIKRTWGPQITMRVGFGAISLVFTLLSLAVTLLFVAVVAIMPGSHPGITGALIVGAVVACILVLCAISLVIKCLELLYTAVLYSYARTGMLPDEIVPELLPPAGPR